MLAFISLFLLRIRTNVLRFGRTYRIILQLFYLHRSMCNPTSNGAEAGPASKQLTVTVRGVTYDISGFKHPGGGIIRYLASRDGEAKVDATNAFNEFHFRNQAKVERFLKSLPVVDAPLKTPVESAKHQALSADFAKVRRSLWSRYSVLLISSMLFYSCARTWKTKAFSSQA